MGPQSSSEAQTLGVRVAPRSPRSAPSADGLEDEALADGEERASAAADDRGPVSRAHRRSWGAGGGVAPAAMDFAVIRFHPDYDFGSVPPGAYGVAALFVASAAFGGWKAKRFVDRCPPV